MKLHFFLLLKVTKLIANLCGYVCIDDLSENERKWDSTKYKIENMKNKKAIEEQVGKKEIGWMGVCT